MGEEERVVGVHIIGLGSDEAMQGFGVAVKMGGASRKTENYTALTCWQQLASRTWMTRLRFIPRRLKVRRRYLGYDQPCLTEISTKELVTLR